MTEPTKTNEDLEKIVDEVKPYFEAKSTIRSIAVFLITNYPDLTQDQMATVVQLVKHRFGLHADTSGSCIGWYKQDMKKQDNSEGMKSAFLIYLGTLPEKEKNDLLLNLARKYQDILVKTASAADLEKHMPIQDVPEIRPTKEQVAVQRSNAKAKETTIKVAPVVAPVEVAEINPVKLAKTAYK